VNIRPLHIRAVKKNIDSIQVLDKSGFRVVGEDKSFENGCREEVATFIFVMR